jgi:hypothetical protein
MTVLSANFRHMAVTVIVSIGNMIDPVHHNSIRCADVLNHSTD